MTKTYWYAVLAAALLACAPALAQQPVPTAAGLKKSFARLAQGTGGRKCGLRQPGSGY